MRSQHRSPLLAPALAAARAVVLLGVPLLASCNSDSWYGTGPGAEASVTTPTGVQAGLVSVTYTLSGEITSSDISVTYSTDGVTYRTARQGPGGDGTSDLSVSQAGDTHIFVWDSGEDLAESRQATVTIRIRPEDGESGLSGNVTVHNASYLAAVENRVAGRVRLYLADVVEGDLEHLATADTGGMDPHDALWEDGHLLVAHTTTHNIAVLKLDEEAGTLTPVSGSPFATDGTGSKYLASDGDHIFVANPTSGTITIFNWEAATGKLTLNGASGQAAAGCRALVVRSSRLYVASETTGGILIFDIDDNGELLQNSASPVTAGGLTAPVILTRIGTRLYASNAASAAICAFTFLGDGDLAPVGGSPFTTSTSGLTDLSASGSKLFAVSGAGASLLALTIDGFGALTEDAGSPFTLSGPAFCVRAGGDLAAAGTTTSRSIDSFIVSESGAVNEAESSPLDAAIEILRLAISD